ncbi:MAG: hypothetical protein SV775_05505 [Thermodesulfobacteriota bacterium]|nr:hypothetical protein [Thermodesulfobacteriota bacterium]
MRGLGQEKKSAFYSACLEEEFQVLVEGWHSEERGIGRGMSDNYLPVLFVSSQDLNGRLVAMRMERVEHNMLVGSIARRS